jgi:glucose-induced degradation protein 4
MPTPASDEFMDARSLHSTCPPEDERAGGWRTTEDDDIRDEDAVAAPDMIQQPSPPPSESQRSPVLSDTYSNDQRIKQVAMADEMQTSSSETLSPVSMEDTQEESEQSEHCGSSGGYTGGSSSMSNDFSNIRVRLSLSSWLPRETRIKRLHSLFHLHHPHFCGRGANSMGLSNPSVKYMMYRLR